MWYEITNPFKNFACCTVEVWELINNVILHFIRLIHAGIKLYYISKEDPRASLPGAALYIPHDNDIKRKHLPRYWPSVRRIHRSPVNSSHKGQRRGALMFSLICARINGWVNNREAGDLRRYRGHYDITVMWKSYSLTYWYSNVEGRPKPFEPSQLAILVPILQTNLKVAVVNIL